MTTPWHFTKLWMTTAYKNTMGRMGLTASIITYSALALAIGTAAFAWHYHFDFHRLSDKWQEFLTITMIGGIGAWSVAFIFSAVTTPYQLYFELERSGAGKCAALAKERDDAIAARGQRIEKQEAYRKLTAMIANGTDLREKIETAVLRPSAYGTTMADMSPMEDAESQVNIWQIAAENTAKEHFPGLYPRLLAIRNAGCEPAKIGPSHKSQSAAKVDQMLVILSEHAARFCD
jgi:hypothetical protein